MKRNEISCLHVLIFYCIFFFSLFLLFSFCFPFSLAFFYVHPSTSHPSSSSFSPLLHGSSLLRILLPYPCPVPPFPYLHILFTFRVCHLTSPYLRFPPSLPPALPPSLQIITAPPFIKHSNVHKTSNLIAAIFPFFRGPDGGENRGKGGGGERE